MTTFDKREEAFEQQFAHDEELRFKATARRNKLIGLWAAEKMGLSGAEADSYALSVVMSAFEDKGDQEPRRMAEIRREVGVFTRPVFDLNKQLKYFISLSV